ncbi:MAG: hypothetical protein GY950_00115 [bacterium]|nr:hypothetical protein [bacterium]
MNKDINCIRKKKEMKQLAEFFLKITPNGMPRHGAFVFGAIDFFTIF